MTAEQARPFGHNGRVRKHGRAVSVNILTHARWWLGPWQWFQFLLARRSRWLVENVLPRRAVAVQLKRLDFLHSGRWDRFGGFAGLSSFPTGHLPWHRWELPWRRWMLFSSNFNQQWDDYFDAFMDVIGSGIDGIWGPSEGYPGYPRPLTRYLTTDWVSPRLLRSDFYYSAYPEATAHDVRSALRVQRELCAFAANQGTTVCDETFDIRFTSEGDGKVRGMAAINASQGVVGELEIELSHTVCGEEPPGEATGRLVLGVPDHRRSSVQGTLSLVVDGDCKLSLPIDLACEREGDAEELRLKGEVLSLELRAASSDGTPAVGWSGGVTNDGTFVDARTVDRGSPGFDALVRRLEPCLGLPDAGDHLVCDVESEDGRVGEQHSGMWGIVSLLPVKPSEVGAVEAAIERLNYDAFDSAGSIHFARFVLVHRSQPAGRRSHREVRLRNTWLIVAMDFDGPFSGDGETAPAHRNRRRLQKDDVAHLSKALTGSDEWPALKAVFDCCERKSVPEDASPAEALTADLLLGQLKRYNRYYDYPEATVPMVLKALTVQRRFIEWLGGDAEVFPIAPARVAVGSQQREGG